MQLHVCLVLFVITADKSLASPPPSCGGGADVDLLPEPVGLVNLTVSDQVSLCTWTLHFPPHRTLLLRVSGLEGGSSVWVRCVGDQRKEEEEEGGASSAMVLVSGCHGNQAVLTWTGAGRSPHVIQLSYQVQEDERNSSVEDHTALLLLLQTGTSFTSQTPDSETWLSGTQGVRGRLREAPESLGNRGPPSVGRLLPASPLQGGGRGTLPLPEEARNNGADTSGAASATDGPVSATHPESNMENTNWEPLLAQTDETLRDAGTFLAIGHTLKHTIARFSDAPASSSSTWEGATFRVPRVGGGTPGENPPRSWRNQRSTDSDQSSAITSDPLSNPTDTPLPSTTRIKGFGLEPDTTDSTTSFQRHSETDESSITELATSTVAVPSFHPTDLPYSVSVSLGTVAFESSDNSEWTSKASPVSHLGTETSDVTMDTHTFPSLTEVGDTSLAGSPSTPAVTLTLVASVQNSVTTATVEDANTSFGSSSLTPGVTLTPGNIVQNSSATETSTAVEDADASFASSSLTPGIALTLGVSVQSATETPTEMFTLSPSNPPRHEDSPTPAPTLPTSTFPQQLLYALQTHSEDSGNSHAAQTPTSATTVATHSEDETSIIAFTPSHKPLLSSTHKQAHETVATTQAPLSSATQSDFREPEVLAEDELWLRLPGRTIMPSPRQPPARTTPSNPARATLRTSASAPWSPVTTPTPRFYIVPDQPAAVKVDSIELLLQMIVEDARAASTTGLEEDTSAWMEPYLQKAPGFRRLLGVWSSGHAVQSLVEFRTSGALKWLSITGPNSLLQRTGLAQAVSEGRRFRSSRVTNITLGGLQGAVCDWLLQCPAGFRCVSQPNSAEYNCSSVCRSEHCHHHGICTHHPAQLPVCRCVVGEDFWFMGERCDVRMTRARLVATCLSILLIMVTVIGASALVAVRRYKAVLIQAKVDQTRSSYRRFNHFDELSGRFWQRSGAGSADSMDNPAFTRSDELLHLRALDRPCCYHDDTLSLASTCPSHGTHINTIYPHSSQYAWRGSELSVGEGVLDSGKASDLSVCSWPVEPIQWTPFPLLQQLQASSQRAPTARVSRPRSYCEGMELVDLGRSWTA